MYGPLVLYLDLEWMHHDLHQHLLVRQEAVQVQALALYSLRIFNQTISFKTRKIIPQNHVLRDESLWHTLLRNMA